MSQQPPLPPPPPPPPPELPPPVSPGPAFGPKSRPGAPPPPPIQYGSMGPPPSPLQYLAADNTSGQGEGAAVPPEIRGWNWGGFLATWIWALVHKAWFGFALGFLCGLPGAIVLGLKGNEWAWQFNRYESVEHFREVQRKWAIWSAAVVGAIMLMYMMMYAVIFAVQFFAIGHTP